MPLPILHLHLRTEYWLQVLDGYKTAEFRARTAYWKRRLVDADGRAREFAGLVLYNAFRGGPDQRIELPWRGYRLDSIYHRHFGDDLAHVYAIRLDLGSVPASRLQRLREAAAS